MSLLSGVIHRNAQGELWIGVPELDLNRGYD